MGYKPPKPKFKLAECVTSNVKEPTIEFHGYCKVCEIPIEKSYEDVEFCSTCYSDLWKTLFGEETCDKEFKHLILVNHVKSKHKN